MTNAYLRGTSGETGQEHDQLLEEVQDRVLWLAIKMVQFANQERPNSDGIKVGGHQASSASAATILTSLFFDHMKPGDRISVKPHASPVFHAIQYLLGNLDRQYLERFRDFHGLQSYPSRTKDPDGVDFSTGSVGLGSIAPNFAALVEQYLATRMEKPAPHRFVALVGDAELDEGSVWETIIEPHLQRIPNILWVVDLNRQSLDRVISGIRVQLWREMFAANGWHVIDAKYGIRLQRAFTESGGELLRESIDSMPNEVYQRLLRSKADALRTWLPKFCKHADELTKFLNQRDDNSLLSLFQNLGGHDFTTLRDAFNEAESSGQPSVVFAYTLKGWRLPSIGDHQNHSVLLTPAQIEELRLQCRVGDDPWAGFDLKSAAGQFCAAAGQRLRAGLPPKAPERSFSIPTALGRGYKGRISTQQAFGMLLVDLARDLPELAQRIVTASPDVASSTNLGGWINKSGVWNKTPGAGIPEDNTLRSLKWAEGPLGNHIELGISETNLFMLLGQLGLSSEMHGHTLFPVGTLYDPFVCRGLEAFIYSLYAGSKFIVVGTPSGVTLSREGGAHQSIATPSIGIALPGLVYYEPCFAQELEWILLNAMQQIERRESSTYLRLTTKRIDQSLFPPLRDSGEAERRRRQVLDGAYRLYDSSEETGYLPGENVVHLFAAGAILTEAFDAVKQLRSEGVYVNLINVTSPGRLFQRYQAACKESFAGTDAVSQVFADIISRGEQEHVPVVTVIDGDAHALAWIGGALGCRTIPLGISSFGQSGALADLYREHQINAQSIVAACMAALDTM